MTLEEATQLSRIAAGVDGGCPCCVRSVVDDLNEAFPQFAWTYDEDNLSNSVTVREKDNA